MKVIDNNIYNTGGGCMTQFLTVEDLSGTRSIAITDECIVGYNTVYEKIVDERNELWYADSYEKLAFTIGEENAEVIKQLNRMGGNF